MVLTWAATVLALGVFQAIAGILRHRMAVTNWISAGSRVQHLVARHASALGSDLPRQVATGEVVAVTANDVERIGGMFDVTARLAGAIAAFIGIAVVLLIASPTLGLIVLIGMPVLTIAIGPLLRPLEKRESTQRTRYGATAELASDTVAGLRVLRGIGGEELFLERYRESSQEVRRAAIDVARIRSLMEALQVLLPGIFVVTITYIGARFALDGRIDVGELVAFYGYTAFLVLPLRTVTDAADRIVRGRVSAGRVVRVLSLTRATPEPLSPAREPMGDILSDPQSGLVVESGRLIALVCRDPQISGELADRLAGYAPSSVTLGGTLLADLPREVVRRRILLQDKDPVILSGSIRDLLDVPGTGRVTLVTAIEAACADDILDGLGGPDEGLRSRLPERGRTLSGGQRQRLSLARSYMADPGILILDEPTSAVDAHTEALIADRLRAVRSGCTTIVLTTSPLILERCDLVAFAPDGVVQRIGTHRELLSDRDYRWVVSREDDA
jgi:ABC-type multidrug transport system fused ATPase/permease subunit